jgi:hypothetical protein
MGSFGGQGMGRPGRRSDEARGRGANTGWGWRGGRCEEAAGLAGCTVGGRTGRGLGRKVREEKEKKTMACRLLVGIFQNVLFYRFVNLSLYLHFQCVLLILQFRIYGIDASKMHASTL